MKKIKIEKCLFLLFAIASLTIFVTSLTVFAGHTDGSTEVVARIETTSSETTNTDTNDNSSDLQDDSSVLTGDTVYIYVVITLFVLIISMLVIFLCINNKSIDKENKANNKNF